MPICMDDVSNAAIREYMQHKKVHYSTFDVVSLAPAAHVCVLFVSGPLPKHTPLLWYDVCMDVCVQIVALAS